MPNTSPLKTGKGSKIVYQGQTSGAFGNDPATRGAASVANEKAKELRP